MPTQISSNKCFGGEQRRYRHTSATLGCEMIYGVYLPPQALAGEQVPALYWLSGLTCNDENFSQKAGAQRVAAELGIALIMPDTSPRGEGVPADPAGGWDFGLGAGFYVNATEAPWSRQYRMHDYIVQELPAIAEKQFPFSGKRGISGHSMGGHGALICALRNPGRYQSLSAFSPIANPMNSAWGQKAFGHFFGEDRERWREWDASELLAGATEKLEILVDQGDADGFLDKLLPEALVEAAKAAGHPLELRMQPGYDHSYFFIATFIEDHLRHHARGLR